MRVKSWSGFTCKLGCRLLLTMATGQGMRGKQPHQVRGVLGVSEQQLVRICLYSEVS